MKKHGKLLSLILAVMLAVMMLVSASGLEIFIIASSDDYENYSTSARYLETIGVMQGYEDGELHLEEPILRYQAALFFARLLTGVVDANSWGTGPSAVFADVAEYGPAIDVVAELNVIRGYSPKTFGYSDGIRYQDMCAMMVRALGYETEDMVASYPMSYVLKIKDLGLDLKNVKPADYLNRGQTARMVYDALVTEIVETTDEKALAIEKIVAAINGTDTVDTTKDTYLERNFDVSATMYFEIVANENYAANNHDFAEEGYITAVELVENEYGILTTGDDWKIAVDDTVTGDVTEAELIGKCLVLIFDDKEPSVEKLEDEECTIVHADVVIGAKYENLGELSYVKFDEDYRNLTLGAKTVKVEDLEKYALIWQYGTEDNDVIEHLNVDELIAAMEEDTYFALETYDYNKDGNIDTVVYKPYTFGQYAQRTYSGKTYTMVGQYRDSAVYDVTTGADKTDDNKTYFVEYFLGKGTTAAAVASKSYTNYRPGDTSLKISQSTGALSETVTVTGKEIKTGDFMIYYYNPLVNKLEVVENLGSYQIGALSGFKSAAQTYTIDGSVMSVGLPGAISGNVGLLTGDGAFAKTVTMARIMVANYEKGENNAKYLEYDGKVVYLEPYGGSEIVVGSDYAIVDIDETLDVALDADEDAIDIPLDETTATVQRLDPATGKFSEIKVEYVVYVDGTGAEATYSFKNAAEKQAMGIMADMEVYNFFKANGVIYAIEDEDENGSYELYAYGTDGFNVLGAKTLAVAEGEPQVYFNYNKSIEYVDPANMVGVSANRVSTNANTVSIVIGQDGYAMVKGALGTNSTAAPNELYLSDAAIVLESTDDQITIFDPVGYVVAGVANNVYKDVATSIWNTGDGRDTNDGIKYYMVLSNTVYGGSTIVEDSDGNPVKNDDGDLLYSHEYKNLYNLETGSGEIVTLVTTELDAPATEVINSISGVIRYDEENNSAVITTFGEVFVDNGEYSHGGFAWLAAKDRISFATQPKDKNGNGVISKDEEGKSVYYNEDSDKVYQALSSLNVTFIDLDEGAAVDTDEYSFTDAYVFYKDDESNRKYYASVELEDRTEGIDFPEGTYPVKRHIIDAKDISGNIGNGKITALTAGKAGLIASQGFYRWNGWCDYLIPAVDEDGETIWAYEGSLRVRVTYYAYINYDEDADSVDAVVVRVGKVIGVVGTDETVPEIKDTPTDPSYNFTEE